MDLRLSGQTSIFGGVFFVFKSLLAIERQKKLSDENIVNIALIAFCPLAVTKLAHWPMSSLLSCGLGLSGR